MPDEITYVTVTGPQRANLIRERLAQIETEHARLALNVETPVTGQANPGDQTRLAEMAAQIRKLQERLAAVE